MHHSCQMNKNFRVAVWGDVGIVLGFLLLVKALGLAAGINLKYLSR